MFASYTYRLFVNGDQQRLLSTALESHRRLYNAALDGKLLCWETAGHNWTFAEQCRWIARIRRSHPFWSLLVASSCEQTLRRLDRSYRAFFSAVKAGGRAGRPRFRSPDRFNSFTLRSCRGAGDGWRVVDGKLRVKGIGSIRVRWHRPLPTGGRLKQCVIRRVGDKWFAVLSIELPLPSPNPNAGLVGIDVGLKTFVTTSDGDELGDSRSLENVLPELRRRQRALSRCKNGSNRRKQVKSRVVALHAKVRNTRRDLHHKVARSLVDRYGVIAAESLNIKGMLKNHRLARRISDAGWYSFTQILISKAASAGCQVVLVDAKNTSQQCSSCGEMVRKSLAVRVHKCECGCVLDRDVNAAINILGRAVPEGVKAGLLALS